MTKNSLEDRCRAVLEELALCKASDPYTMRRLVGGVASDIAAVDCGDKSYCIKFALAKLQVQDDWFAPVHRSRAEFAWLNAAYTIAPEHVPRVYGWSDEQYGFAMEFLDGPDVSQWKADLLAGDVKSGLAAQVGDVLGRIHAASTRAEFDRSPFENMDDFEALRIEPYLRFTAGRHDDLSAALTRMADSLAKSRTVLVHGDVSPKNILVRDGRPVLLDAECATLGDPAFDVGFCLNHLVLKSVHLPRNRESLHQATLDLWEAYQRHVAWEEIDVLLGRISQLLPALMLARIDGKSPVEYLSESNRSNIRAASRALLKNPPETLQTVLEGLPQGVAA